jgi:hypothetical protein
MNTTPGDNQFPAPSEEDLGITRMTTEQINAKLLSRGIPASEVRPAALPEFDGASDQHVLAGGVTAGEAFTLFEAHFATDHFKALGVSVSGISAAQVAGRKVWLPDLTNRDQARKHFQHESYRLDKALQTERGFHEATKGDLRLTLRAIDALKGAAAVLIFDNLEGKDSPHRRAYRTDLRKRLKERHVEWKDVEAHLKQAAELLGDWMEAHTFKPDVLTKAKAKKAKARAKKARKKPAKAKKRSR